MTLAFAGLTLAQGDHVVHFYGDDSELVHNVGRCLTDGLRAGATAVVIATEAHRHAFAAEIAAAGLDPVRERRNGTLVLLDADTAVGALAEGGSLDTDVFRTVMGSVVQQAGSGGRPVLAYGEMVALLWEAGNVVAALELEEAWNELSRRLAFALVCGYPSELVTGEHHRYALAQVCQMHSSVVNVPVTDPAAATVVGAEVSASFDPQAGAPRAARHFVTDVLDRWGHEGALLEDAQLLVTELATNAVVHAQSRFSVTARPHGAGVHLWVSDSSRANPVLGEPDPLDTSGRGLYLVDTIAADWGVEVTDDGKTVWAELLPAPETSPLT